MHCLHTSMCCSDSEKQPPTLHYRLRAIRGGPLGLVNFTPHFITNHSRRKCKELYDPKKQKKTFQRLILCQQNKLLPGRVNSMTKTHFHFMIHRLIKGRNRYTSRCYKRNRKPLLPSAKVVKSKK